MSLSKGAARSLDEYTRCQYGNLERTGIARMPRTTGSFDERSDAYHLQQWLHYRDTSEQAASTEEQ